MTESWVLALIIVALCFGFVIMVMLGIFLILRFRSARRRKAGGEDLASHSVEVGFRAADQSSTWVDAKFAQQRGQTLSTKREPKFQASPSIISLLDSSLLTTPDQSTERTPFKSIRPTVAFQLREEDEDENSPPVDVSETRNTDSNVDFSPPRVPHSILKNSPEKRFAATPRQLSTHIVDLNVRRSQRTPEGEKLDDHQAFSGPLNVMMPLLHLEKPAHANGNETVSTLGYTYSSTNSGTTTQLQNTDLSYGTSYSGIYLDASTEANVSPEKVPGFRQKFATRPPPPPSAEETQTQRSFRLWQEDVTRRQQVALNLAALVRNNIDKKSSGSWKSRSQSSLKSFSDISQEAIPEAEEEGHAGGNLTQRSDIEPTPRQPVAMKIEFGPSPTAEEKTVGEFELSQIEMQTETLGAAEWSSSSPSKSSARRLVENIGTSSMDSHPFSSQVHRAIPAHPDSIRNTAHLEFEVPLDLLPFDTIPNDYMLSPFPKNRAPVSQREINRRVLSESAEMRKNTFADGPDATDMSHHTRRVTYNPHHTTHVFSPDASTDSEDSSVRSSFDDSDSSEGGGWERPEEQRLQDDWFPKPYTIEDEPGIPVELGPYGFINPRIIPGQSLRRERRQQREREMQEAEERQRREDEARRKRMAEEEEEARLLAAEREKVGLLGRVGSLLSLQRPKDFVLF